eukprot:GEZU01022555.1.p1 GENE.GEZU01022555.1~~GEZU01022555.1.p1  ORF type:complete len:399 (-),score=90.87 GEZU01022555.1:827-1939(-)
MVVLTRWLLVLVAIITILSSAEAANKKRNLLPNYDGSSNKQQQQRYLWPQTQIPFVPTNKPTGFKHAINNLFPAKDAFHHANDVAFALPCDSASVDHMSASFEFAILPDNLIEKNIAGEDVQVFIQTGAPSSSANWTMFASGTTDSKGFLTVEPPADITSTPGTIYPVRFLLEGDNTQANTAYFVLKPNTSTVVFDIDGTLTISNGQLTEEVILNLFLGTYYPKPWPGVVDVVNAYFEKGYNIVYLTGRPNILWNITLDWLIHEGFPPGMVHLSRNISTGTSKHVEAYKADFLDNHLLKAAQTFIFAVYGNELTDILAYQTTPVSRDRIFIVGKHGGELGSVPITSYVDHLKIVEEYPDAAVPGPRIPAF